jgi:hypothetical protein
LRKPCVNNIAMKTIITFMLMIFVGLTSFSQDQKYASTNGALRLFADKDDLTSVITLIPDGSTVEVISADSTFTFVRFDNAEGYVKSDRLTEVIPEVEAEPAASPSMYTDQEMQAQEQAQAQEQQYYAPVDRYDMLLNKYGTDIGKRIYQHKVWKGVSSEMARDSWGKPIQINRMYVDQSVDEEWIYSKKYLYFRDDVLIDWGPVKN